MLRTRSQALHALVALSVAGSLATCGREPAAPYRPATLAVAAVLPAGLDLAAFNLSIDSIRLIAVNSQSVTVFDKTYGFPANQSSVAVQADIPLAQSPETFDVTIELRAATAVLFSGTQTISLASGSNTSPPPIPVTYTGPGQNVAALTLGPLDSLLTEGSSLLFRVSAKDGGGANVPSFYVSWTTSDTIAVPIDATGTLKAPLLRRKITVQATTPNSVTASTTLQFVPGLSAVSFDSGCAQSALPGVQLLQPIVARVLGTDGLGVPGVQVAFSAVTSGGLVGTPSAVTDTGGRARTLVTLPTTAGPAQFQASVAGLSAAVCTPTVLNNAATHLGFTSQPTGSITAGTSSPVVVTAEDAQGNPSSSFTGNVTLTLGIHPPLATLGTITVAAVAGVATFSSFGFTVAGSYTLVASANGLASGTSAQFTVIPAAPAALAFTVQPTSGLQGNIITPPIVVAVHDNFANLITTASNTVTLSIGANPGKATLGGTTSIAATGGLATFSNITLNASGSGYTLAAMSPGLKPDTSLAFSQAVRPPGITWVNPAGGNWSTAGNWSPARVPGPSDTVSIVLPGAYLVTLDVNDTVAFLAVGDTIGGISMDLPAGRRLFIDSSATILRAGSMVLAGSDTIGGPGNLTNQGVLSMTGSVIATPFFTNSSALQVAGTSAITGTFSNASTGALFVYGSANGDATLTFATGFLNAGGIVLENTDATARNVTLAVTSGVLTNIPGSSLQTDAASSGGNRILNALLDNQGAVLVSHTLTLDQANATHGNSGQIVLSGGDLNVILSGVRPAFTNSSGAVIDVGTNKLVITNQSTGTFNNQPGGTLEGSGTIDIGTSSFITNGIVTVGVASPAILTFTGPYTQGPTPSVLNVFLTSPTTPGTGFSQFQVSDTVNLQGGTLNATLTSMYTAGSYPVITVPTGKIITGDFTTKTLPTNPLTGGQCVGAVIGLQYVITCP